MKTLETNFFGLEKPDQWICALKVFTVGHSSLQIEIYDPQSKGIYYLNFIGVDYFDCPVVWRGADFRIAGADECLKILRLTSRHERSSDQSLLEDYNLFIARITNVNSTDVPTYVKIIAAPAASLSERNLFLHDS